MCIKKTSYRFSKHGMRYLFYQPEVFNTDSQEPNDTKQKSHNILLPHVSTIFHHCPQFNHIHRPSHKGSVPRYTFFMLKPRPGRFFLAFLSSNTKERRRRMMRTRYTFQQLYSVYMHGCYSEMLVLLCWVFVEKGSKKSMWTEMESIWDHLILQE